MAGSWAAAVQIPNTAVGSFFAIAQSAGSGTAGLAVVNGITQGVAATGVGIGAVTERLTGGKKAKAGENDVAIKGTVPDQMKGDGGPLDTGKWWAAGLEEKKRAEAGGCQVKL
jgi:hypothetical protein